MGQTSHPDGHSPGGAPKLQCLARGLDTYTNGRQMTEKRMVAGNNTLGSSDDPNIYCSRGAQNHRHSRRLPYDLISIYVH